MQLAEDTPLEFLVLVIRSLCYKAPQELPGAMNTMGAMSEAAFHTPFVDELKF